MFGLAPMYVSSGSSPTLRTLMGPLRAWSQEKRTPNAAQMREIKQRAHFAREASREACFEELTALLRGRYVDLALQGLLDTGLMGILLPEVEATSRMGPQAGQAFKDVWEHTKAVVWQSVPSPSVRWAALLHDIGKVSTLKIHPEGRVTFMDHERVSYELFESQIRGRIAFPGALGDRIAGLILHHQRPSQYTSTWTDAAVRRFDRDMGEKVEELLQLSRADITSKIPGRRKARVAAISELARRIREQRERSQKKDPLPKGFGNALVKVLHMEPGPQVGRVIGALRAAIAAGEIEEGQESPVYIQYVRSQGWTQLPP